MSRKSATSPKAKKAKAQTALRDLKRKGVSQIASQKVRGGGINRIVVTDGTIKA